MIFIFWIILWIFLNYFFWGFEFNTILCFFVGIFLIMPVLLKLKFKEIKDTLKNKKLMWINLLLNFVITPLIAFWVSYVIFWLEYYAYILTIILLSIIPGWWLLMNWLTQTKSNLHVGFSLFAINLFVFSFIYIFYNLWADFYINNYVDLQTHTQNQLLGNNFLSNPLNIKEEQPYWWCMMSELSSKTNLDMPWCSFGNDSNLMYGLYWFIVLILIPFILSRIILFVFKKEYLQNILKYIGYISKLTSFLLIVYIFSLSYIRQILNLDLIIILKSLVSIVIFYMILYFIIKLILKNSNFDANISKSIFWNAFTRFITLALVLSVLYAISWNEPWIIIIPVIAYFVQIIFSTLIVIYYNKWKF